MIKLLAGIFQKRGSITVRMIGAPVDMQFSVTGSGFLSNWIASRLSYQDKKILINQFKDQKERDLHQRRSASDDALMEDFKINKPEMVHVNIWDDFSDEVGETYLYVEHRLPLSVEHDIILAIESACESYLAKNHINKEISMVDGAITYPGLIYSESRHYMLHRGYRLNLKNIKGSQLGSLVNHINELDLKVHDIKIVAISES